MVRRYLATAYIVPFYFVHDRPTADEDYLYSFSAAGQKIEWMSANLLVCVELDEVASYDQWMSVVIFGQYEELPSQPDEGPALRGSSGNSRGRRPSDIMPGSYSKPTRCGGSLARPSPLRATHRRLSTLFSIASVSTASQAVAPCPALAGRCGQGRPPSPKTVQAGCVASSTLCPNRLSVREE
jgi:nitroimidazol reductase NimA-like FMN-containing flavoprotein (pyridoxamine 5'-phosphate oxidase superfamily)